MFLTGVVSPEELHDCLQRIDVMREDEEQQDIPEDQSDFSALLTEYINQLIGHPDCDHYLTNLELVLIACLNINMIVDEHKKSGGVVVHEGKSVSVLCFGDDDKKDRASVVNNMVKDTLSVFYLNFDRDFIKNKIAEAALEFIYKDQPEDKAVVAVYCGLEVLLREM